MLVSNINRNVQFNGPEVQEIDVLEKRNIKES